MYMPAYTDSKYPCMLHIYVSYVGLQYALWYIRISQAMIL